MIKGNSKQNTMSIQRQYECDNDRNTKRKLNTRNLHTNFVRRRSSTSLGSVKLNRSWHCFTNDISNVYQTY